MMTDHTFSTTDLLSYFTGDLREEKRRAIEAHVASCASCRRFLVDLESEKSAFLADHPFDATVTLPKRQEPHRVQPFLRHQYYALAASLVLFVAAGYLYLATRPGTEYRIKGDVGLKAFVQNSTGDIEKRRDRIYHTGEKIQFLYSCAAENWLVLLGIDTAGTITTYYPAAGDSSCMLERGADIPLPNSIVLDEYTGREAFLAVFSKKPLFVPEVTERIAALFTRTRSIESIDVTGNDAIAVEYVITVLPGDGR